MPAILNRINPMGMQFQLGAHSRNETYVVLIGTKKKIIVNAPIEDMNKAWYGWMMGQFIQNAFHFLNADEREFLMTGITKEEWDATFNEEEN